MTKELVQFWLFSYQVFLQDYVWECYWQKLSVTWKNCALTVFYVLFPFASSLALWGFFKKRLSYLLHSISTYLHGKLLTWTSRFYLSFCCTVFPRILNVLILMNRVILIILIWQSYFMLAFSYAILHRMVFVLIVTTNRRYII